VPVCPDCVKAEEASFQKLKDYLDDHPENNITTVSRETGVPIKRILKYIQEGRIEMSMGISGDNLLTCARCGASIKMGSMCDECRTKYNSTIQELQQEQEKNKMTGTGMHSLKADNERKR
jgi:hypothetical protein